MLGIAVNFEPTRIGLVPLLLARERPLLQLLAYLVGSLTVSLGFGMAALFAFDRFPFGTSSSSGGKAQIAVGAVALVIAAIMAVRWMRARGQISLEATQPGGADKFTESVRRVLTKGRSPWLSGLIGVGVGLPSVDYLAVLIIIATSHTPPLEQAAALLVFTLTGSLVVIAPLVSYLIAPAKTLEILTRFGTWVRARSRIEYACLLALIGFLLIFLGWSHL
jgi:hypothetical protein